MKRNNSTENNLRINLVICVFCIVFGILIMRLFSIQVLGHKQYRAQAQEQYWNLQEIPAKRGDILSSDKYPLATTQVAYLMYAEPKVIANPFQTAYDLAQLLAKYNKYEFVDPHTYYQKRLHELLVMDLFWVKLHDGLTPEEKEEIEALQIKGIGFEPYPMRYYPEKTLSSHVLGFVAQNETGDPQGYFGIEGRLNGDLKGKPGRVVQEQDAVGAPILVGGFKKVDSIDGRDVVLTINRAVQYLVEQRLEEGVKQYGAKSGNVIVMDPFTGDIIAMANYPTYDPANFNDFGDESKVVERQNFSISQTYEPGSVLKALTVAAAVDIKKVTRNSTFVDEGPVRYSDYYIDNWDKKHHGVQTVVELLQKSNNIGAAWVGTLVGRENLADYLNKFGFGRTLGIDLEGEDTGVIRNPKGWTDIDLATISFGQGVSATPLQVLNSFNALANGGNLMKPRIVSKLIGDGKEIEIPTKTLNKVVSAETSDEMVYMLTKAAEGGEASYFNLKNYHVAGKTGTAQIPVDGKYDPSKTNATFVGFLTESKKYSMIVRLEEPSSSPYASETAVPLWMQITDDLVKYYGIPPDKVIEQSSE
jgi:stage V sporulation protein D (sporulation-specific penicillin-binding protein)